MSIKVMTRVFDCPDKWLVGSRRVVLGALANESGDDGYCMTTIETIARYTGLEQEYVKKVLAKLEKRKYIYNWHCEGNRIAYRLEI